MLTAGSICTDKARKGLKLKKIDEKKYL